LPTSEDECKIDSTCCTSRQGNVTIPHITDPFQELAQVFGGDQNLDENELRIGRIAEELEEEGEEMSEDLKDPGIKIAEDIINHLKAGKGVSDDTARRFKSQYLISGKLPDEWRQIFKVDIDEDATPANCRQASTQLMDLQQRANSEKRDSQARLSMTKSYRDKEHRKEFSRQVALYTAKNQKLPAKDTLNLLAEQATADLQEAVTCAELELAFWKDVLNSLFETRKHIEDIVLNLSVEAKMLQHEQRLDGMLGRNEQQ